jgi:hypothetical protein
LDAHAPKTPSNPHGEEALAPSRTMRPGLILRDAAKRPLLGMRAQIDTE